MTKQQFDILYGRDELVLWAMGQWSRTVWETHTGAWSVVARAAARRAKKMVAISQGLKDFYTGHGVPADKIVVAHDGVDLSSFVNPQSKEQARARLGLPLDARIALYVGRLDGWKGTDTLFEASKSLSEAHIVAIGGEPAQVEALRTKYPKVVFLGYRPYKELADNLAAADVLVLPNTAKEKVSAYFTSPLKLFGYMAAGLPIVASNLPSIREILDEQTAVLVHPDEPHALAEGIEMALRHPELGERAKEKVKEYTWNARAAGILKQI
jgi:glycosyltransferase involved in cell wall biosynthesis